MSGSPVYIDGKLVGAVALRISVFSPDSICGITPIESMLEVQDFDTSQPPDQCLRRAPLAENAIARCRNDLLQRLVAAECRRRRCRSNAPLLAPIANADGVFGIQRGSAAHLRAAASNKWESRRCRAEAEASPAT